MRIVSTLVFLLAVLVNSIVCPRVREGKPSGEVPGLDGFRFFVAQAEDIPGVHTKIHGRPLIPVLGPIRVIAKGNFIFAWQENSVIRLLFNSKRELIVVNTLTGMMEQMTVQHVREASPIIDLNRARAAANLRRENEPITYNIGHVQH